MHEPSVLTESVQDIWTGVGLGSFLYIWNWDFLYTIQNSNLVSKYSLQHFTDYKRKEFISDTLQRLYSVTPVREPLYVGIIITTNWS
jgi:hypothetical protein